MPTLHSVMGLLHGNLHIRDDVRISTFLVTGVYRRRRVAIGCAIRDGRVRVQGGRVEKAIDFGIRAARTGVHRPVHIVARDIR